MLVSYSVATAISTVTAWPALTPTTTGHYPFFSLARVFLIGVGVSVEVAVSVSVDVDVAVLVCVAV